MDDVDVGWMWVDVGGCGWMYAIDYSFIYLFKGDLRLRQLCRQRWRRVQRFRQYA